MSNSDEASPTSSIAKDFDLLQASIVAEVGQASVSYRAAVNERRSALELAAAAGERLRGAEHLFDLRDVDYTSVVAARLEVALTRTAGVASFRKLHSALGMIEDTIQKPLEDELAIPNNLELRLKKPGMLLNDLRSAVQRVSRLALQDTEVTLVDVTEGGRGPKTTRAGSVRDWMSQFDAQVESLRLETGSIRHLPRPEGSADAMTRHRYLDNAG